MKPTGPEGLCDGSLWGVKEADTGWTSSFPLQNPGTRGHHLRRSHRYQLILHFDCQGLWLPEDPPPEPFPHGDRHDIRYVWHTLRAPCNSWWNIYNSFFLSNAPSPQFFWSTGEWGWYHICFYLFKKRDTLPKNVLMNCGWQSITSTHCTKHFVLGQCGLFCVLLAVHPLPAW